MIDIPPKQRPERTTIVFMNAKQSVLSRWFGEMYIGTTLFASLLGLFLPKALNIGTGVAIEMAKAEVQAAEFTSIVDTIKNLIPANPFASFVNGNMLQVLAFAIILGITCLVLGEKADPFVGLCEAINEISVKIVSAVMKQLL